MRLLPLLLCLLAFCLSCEQTRIFADDLEMAKTAFTERNMPLAERLLERYMREEQNPDKRWEAWELLLKAINANNPEPRASLECLEAMLDEYENDGKRQAWILARMGKCYFDMRQYARAANVWSAYTELADLDEAERIEGLRRLAAAQFAMRQFEAGEETLQQCLALPVPDYDKIYCMLDLADENMARENWEEVANLCQQILDSGPDKKVFGMAGYLRGDALEQLGQKAAALAQFEKARDFYPNPMVMDNRIEHLKKTSKAEKGAK